MKHFYSSNTGVVSKSSVLSGMGTLATQMTLLVCTLLSCSSRPGPGHRATVLLSKRSRNSLKILLYFCLALNCARHTKVRPRYLAVMLH